MNIVCICILLLSICIGNVLSIITCYHCTNTSVDLCGNKTITCRYPADTCYSMLQHNKTLMSRSCVWMGHCSPTFLCKDDPYCDLQCCYEDICNSERMKKISHRDSCTNDVEWIKLSFLHLMLLCVLLGILRMPKQG